MTAPRWPRLLVVRLLLPLGILGALALSAAATVALVERHGVPGGVRPFAVAMLEVIQVAATLLTIFGTTPRLRGRAMLVLVAASCVQLVAGWAAYGWVGLIAPCLAVSLVHLAAEAWAELRDEQQESQSTDPVGSWGGPHTVNTPAASAAAPAATHAPEAPAAPVRALPTRTTPVQARAARPARRPARGAPGRATQAVTSGWEPSMTAVPREPDEHPTTHLRRRAKAVGAPVSGRTAQLRVTVEAAELARAREAMSA